MISSPFSHRFKIALEMAAIPDAMDTAAVPPSREEIYGTAENEYEAGETQFDYYRDEATEDADKLMFAQHAASPTSYWLRTPNAGGANSVRVCYSGSGGALYSGTASYSYGVAPLAILA